MNAVPVHPATSSVHLLTGQSVFAISVNTCLYDVVIYSSAAPVIYMTCVVGEYVKPAFAKIGEQSRGNCHRLNYLWNIKGGTGVTG